MCLFFFFFQAEDGIRDYKVTGVQTCALPISIVYEGIEAQLTHQPLVETRNRKLMRPNPLAPWELRLGDLRVYYRVTEEPKKIVEIAAVGIKRREQTWVRSGRAQFRKPWECQFGKERLMRRF